MDNGSTDARLREAFRQMAPTIDATSFYEDLEARLAPAEGERWSLTAGVVERAGGQERGSAPRRRSGLRVAVFASIAVIVVAAITVGSLEAVKHLGKDQPALVITDDTIGISPGSTGQATTASSRLGELLWKFQTGGQVYSSPTVSGGVVYVGNGSSDTPSIVGHLYAVDARTGLEKWRFETSGGVESSPAVSDGVVYFGSNDGYLYAVDAQSGTEKWTFKTNGSVSSSPAVSDGVVYFGSDDTYVYAVDAQSGAEKWKIPTGDGATSPAVSDGVVYVGTGEYLDAVDAKTGTVRWRFKSVDWLSSSSPAVSDEAVYVCASSWDFQYDHLYLLAVDTNTGQEKWRFESKSTAGGYGSNGFPAVSDGVVYVGSADSYLYAVDAQTGTEKWNFKTDGEVLCSPTISDGAVYVGIRSLEGYLYAVK